MASARIFFIKRGFDILSMGVELIVMGAISPRWLLREGYSMEPTETGFILNYSRSKPSPERPSE